MVESDVPSPELPYAEDLEVNHMTQQTLSPSRTPTSRMQHASATVLSNGAGLGLGDGTGAFRLAIFLFVRCIRMLRCRDQRK